MRVLNTPDLELTRNCVLVPTMGALHGGHASLIQAAARRARIEGVPSAVSIFVNPKQFNDPKDFDTYPDRMEDDLAMCQDAGVDIVFHPSVDTVYPPGQDVTSSVIIPEVASKPGLEDEYRPGHFDGVCKVVSRLFDLCDPSAAVFGEKDFQQLSVIRKMVKDLCMPINIIGVATARAEDGLALSSRNGYLDDSQRNTAPLLHRVLQEMREAIACGYDSYSDLELYAKLALKDGGFEPDYVNICDARSLEQVRPDTEEVVILAAAKLGSTRLIDNVTLTLNPSADWGMLAAN